MLLVSHHMELWNHFSFSDLLKSIYKLQLDFFFFVTKLHLDFLPKLHQEGTSHESYTENKKLDHSKNKNKAALHVANKNTFLANTDNLQQ